MFIISPVQSDRERKELCARLNIGFHPGDLAYRVTVDDREAGAVTFFIKGKKGCIRNVAFYPGAEDFEVMFIAGRTAMEFMDRVGAHEGYFLSPDPSNERLIAALGYKKRDDGSYYLNTEGFFTEHCAHHKEDF